MSSADKKQIGDILCENGSLSRVQLERAIAQQHSGKIQPLGRILVGSGYITADQLSDALLVQANSSVSKSD